MRNIFGISDDRHGNNVFLNGKSVSKNPTRKTRTNLLHTRVRIHAHTHEHTRVSRADTERTKWDDGTSADAIKS